MTIRMRVPNPLLLLVICLALAAALTWILPAGEFERRFDAATGRDVVVAGTYHRVASSPVDPFSAVVAIPRGVVEAADVVGVVLFVGGAWVLLDALGVLARLVEAFVAKFGQRSRLAIPGVTLFFAVMGALANMQEEIVPLVPALLLLGRRLRVDAVTVVAMSAGAAMVGSAFGPTNPFQAGIAMRLAELPPLGRAGERTLLLVMTVAAWMAWTMWRGRGSAEISNAPEEAGSSAGASGRDVMALLCLLAPMAAYVIGALWWDWGFNELSAVFIVGVFGAGLCAGLAPGATLEAYLEGMRPLIPAAVMIGVARSISLVLADGHVVDTLLAALAAPLAGATPATASLLMLPFHALVHVPVSSVSGHAVLTMPLLVPLSDLLGLSRYTTVLAYQIGAGLTELLTPTNGALMAILFGAGVPFGRWFRFAGGGVAVVAAIAVVWMLVTG